MKNILLIFLLTGYYSVFATDKKFPVSDIPDSMRTDAHAVIRLQEEKVKVNSLSSVTHLHHFVVTILDENGDRAGALIAPYDRLQKVININGALYDEEGTLVKKLKSKEIEDISAVSDNNLYEDSRIKVHHFLNNKYPYTVEYFYETEITHTFFFQPWLPQTDNHTSVQYSSYEIEYPNNSSLRHRDFNISKPVMSKMENFSALKWELKNKPAYKTPDAFSFWRDYTPAVFTALSDFQLGDIKGNMETWKGFGISQYQLWEGRDVLPEQIKNKVKEITSKTAGKKEIIKSLYKYLQQNTRYISIQLGIGSFQPFDANYVAQRGYGDCKALVNYMHSLLKEAGISSYYALVNGGDDNFSRTRIIEDFPSFQFNHVILCVPNGKDSIWLECTSQSLPSGYLSGFTSNRKALLIKEDGGVLISTPQYDYTTNKQLRNTSISLDENGDASINVETTYSGQMQDVLFDLTHNNSEEKIRKVLTRAIGIPSYDLNNFKYVSEDSGIPVLKEELAITANNLANVTGKRIFISPNLLSRYSDKFLFDSTRKTDFHFYSSYRQIDSTEILLPGKDYKIEAGIMPVFIQSDFGKYSLICSLKDGKIICRREFERYDAVLPASRQKEILDFFGKIYKADRSRMVLVKGGE